MAAALAWVLLFLRLPGASRRQPEHHWRNGNSNRKAIPPSPCFQRIRRHAVGALSVFLKVDRRNLRKTVEAPAAGASQCWQWGQ